MQFDIVDVIDSTKKTCSYFLLCCARASQVERLLSASNPDPQEFDKAKKMLQVCIIRDSFVDGSFI